MSKKIFHLFLICIMVSSLAGCATLFKSKNAVVKLDSDPQGAVVYINGNRMGRTPLPLKMSHKDPLTITFKKEGYEDKTYIINTKTAAGWVILDCLGGFIPVVIDAVTGNWTSLEETEVKVLLEQ